MARPSDEREAQNSSTHANEVMPEPKRTLPPPNRRRDKAQLSCNLCRRRKLRCDRGQPCGSCRHRGLSLSCTYPPASTIAKSKPIKETGADSHASLSERICQLEGLISLFVEKAGNQAARAQAHQHETRELIGAPTPAKDEEPDDPSDSFGQISLQDSKETYVQNTHWTAILDEITELKNTVQMNSLFEKQHPRISHLTVLPGGSQPITLQEIIEGLPSKSVCDRLLSLYFNYNPLPLIHGPSFLRQYEKFWEDQSDAEPIWIGKLYGLMSLALIFQHQTTVIREDTDQMIQDFNKKINQCLVLGKYEECPPGTIETLCCFMNSQFHYASTKEMSHVITMGVIIRLAQRMGYHRDASHFPAISAFNGEMRRRVWMLITDLDTMLSFAVGLPRLLREFQSDSALPRNLLDTDFDEDTEKLPPSRPPSFETPCQWLVSKHRVTSIYGIITDFSTSIRLPNYAEVMHLDKLLQETYASTPENLLEKPIAKCLMESSQSIMRRIQLRLLVAKAKCVLHYRHLAPARTEERYAYSRKTCIEEALCIVRHHHLMQQETEPGGRFWREKWKISSPLMREVWVMGTTLLCLELNFDLSDHDPNIKRIPLSHNTKKQIIQALRKSYSIWYESTDRHSEPERAMQALEVVFEKVQKQDEAISQKSTLHANDLSTNSTQEEDLTENLLLQETQDTWPELESAMYLDQAMNIPSFESLQFNSPFMSSNIAPEMMDLTSSVDEMLGVSMNYPRFDY